MRFSSRAVPALFASLALVASACGSDSADGAAAEIDESLPTVVVTTNVLADVVSNVAGGQVNVVALMPTGADPHDFQASAQQVAEIGEAAALIVNGESFEEGLLDVIEAAEGDGVAVYEAISSVSTIEFGEGGHLDHDDHSDHDDEHSDEEHADEDGHDHDVEHSDEEHADEDEHDHDDEHSDEEHADEDEHDHDDEHSDEEHADDDGHDHDHAHDGADPHFWQDPARMAVAADGIADFLVDTVEGIDADAVSSAAADYVTELEALDGEVAEILSGVGDRVLITNHDAFGYFADRYDFEVAGTVIPSGSTTDGASAQQLAELAELMQDEGVTAVFAETTVSNDLADALASEIGGDVAVVDLFTGSLGEADSGASTYVEMIRTNAERIADALAG